jgi:Mn2+/Fe2+ NRAMP family transporter
VLAGSAAYAVCESFGWVGGLNHKFKDARLFYGVIAVATLFGVMLNFLGIDPIKALYWSAILNGALAAPLMAAMLFIATNRRIMGKLTLSPMMRISGWVATIVMAGATLAFLIL